MNDHVTVVEERLRSRGLVLFLLAVTVVVLVVAFPLLFAQRATSPSPGAFFAFSVVLAALLGATFLFSKVIVRVIQDSRGRSLVVAYGPGGRVRQVFGPDRFVSASAQHYSMLQMGGWGYRGSLRLLRQASLVTRGGDALQLQLTGQRRFIITVENPTTFVDALSV
ncbi:MAG: hypothetical protein ACYCPT_08925 [Acidimicrobiales bacterium]